MRERMCARGGDLMEMAVETTIRGAAVPVAWAARVARVQTDTVVVVVTCQ